MAVPSDSHTSVTTSPPGPAQTPIVPTPTNSPSPQSRAVTSDAPLQGSQLPASASGTPSVASGQAGGHTAAADYEAAGVRQQGPAAVGVRQQGPAAAGHGPEADPLPGPLQTSEHASHRSAQAMQQQPQQPSPNPTGVPDQPKPAADAESDEQTAIHTHPPEEAPQQAVPEAGAEVDDNSTIAASPISSTSAPDPHLMSAIEAGGTQAEQPNAQRDTDAQPSGSDESQAEAAAPAPDTRQLLVGKDAVPGSDDTAAAQQVSELDQTGTAAQTDREDATAGNASTPAVAAEDGLSGSGEAAQATPQAGRSSDDANTGNPDLIQPGPCQEVTDSTAHSPAASASHVQPASSLDDDSVAAEPGQAAESEGTRHQQLEQVTQEATAAMLEEAAAPSRSTVPEPEGLSQGSGASEASSNQASMPTQQLSDSSRESSIHKDGVSTEGAASAAPAGQQADQLEEQAAATRRQGPQAEPSTTAGPRTDAAVQLAGHANQRALTGSAATSQPAVSTRLSTIQSVEGQPASPLQGSSQQQETSGKGLRQQSRAAGVGGLPSDNSSTQAVPEPKKKQVESKAVPSPRSSAAKSRQNAEMKRQQTTFNPLG